MPTISPEDVRAKLTIASAKEAFDKLNALCPVWIIGEAPEKETVSLFPDIHTKEVGSDALRARGGVAPSFDEAVINALKAIKEDAGPDHILVVVNANQGGMGKATFTYDPYADAFHPYIEW